MITGRFDALGRPFVESRLSVPRLGIEQRVVLLVDTGADRTCLHSRDIHRVRMPIERLGSRTEYRGIGGRSGYYREPALLGFDDEAHTRHYVIELLIAEPATGNEGLPSLLGRDIVNRWYIQYDPENSRLECTVRHADFTVRAT